MNTWNILWNVACRAARGAVLASLLFTLVSCATSPDQGGLRPDMAVARMFETPDLPPEYAFFAYGPQSQPDAILGLAPGWTLEGRYWDRVEDIQAEMPMWNRLIDNPGRVRDQYVGYRLLAPDGSQAGIYYSRWSWLVTRFPRPGVIEAWAPQPTPGERRSLSSPNSFGF